MEKRSKKSRSIIDHMIADEIGPRPKKPASYGIRKKDKSNKAHQDFCEKYDQKLKDWQEKADKIISRIAKKSKESQKKLESTLKPVVPKPFIVTSESIIEAFYQSYQRLYKKKFEKINPEGKTIKTKDEIRYEPTNEPEVLMKTLAYYFNRDKRFFDSELLNKDLSTPSFKKGVLLVGYVGCGKSSIMKSFLSLFRDYMEFFLEKRPVNLPELTKKFRINQVISTQVVNNYKRALRNNQISIDDVLLKLHQGISLYIDDLLKEEILYKSRDNETNIFKDGLTLRDEYQFITHASINYADKDFDGNYIDRDIKISIEQFYYKYNNTVYDRIFNSYNIIELQGRSMRDKR